MASYMDMVTVLMCMFIVLFAMSTVDQKKFEELRNSLASGFGITETEFADTADGVVVPPAMVDEEGEGFSDVDVDLARAELAKLLLLREQIRSNLATAGLESAAEFDISERGLAVRLVSTEAFFEPNSDILTPEVIAVLNAVAGPLSASAYDIAIEGHADQRDPDGRFPTNWELASGRSVQVLRHLVESCAVPPARVTSVGYGSAHPLTAGATPDELALNRRVDVVALSDQPESVRNLIPGLLSGEVTTKPEQQPSDEPPPVVDSGKNASH